MSFVVAVDSGGTFSDCVVLDERGTVTRAKAPSTPPSFEEGVLASVAEAASKLGRSSGELLADTHLFAHGTTVATNLLITRRGAKTALLTTRGHEDAILIGRTVQKVAGLTESEIIDVARLAKADPLVPRSRIFGVDERVDRSGAVVVPLHVDRLDDLAERLRGDGVEAIAVSFLWSFLNPEHERRIGKWLEEIFPRQRDDSGWFVTTSSELAPVLREYERTSTTVLNAYLTPGVNGYLERMSARLRTLGHHGAITVMHSAGGVSSIDEACRRGVSLLSSGPAGGILGTRALAARLGLTEVIATDVGGTSFDVGLLVGGEPSYADTPVFAKYPVALPVIDVPSIGAGGGSIAWIEPETGVLRVGPGSAGAKPGPACYGRGGIEPTVTDANVVLGRIDPNYFLGGRMRLDPERAHAVVVERIADPLGLTAEAAACAIVEIVNAQMADLIRKATIERGLDPARFTIFGYGGAAGLHVGSYADRLGCQAVLIPRAAAVFSAFGIGASDVKQINIVSAPERAPFDVSGWRERFEELEAQLVRQFRNDRLPTQNLHLRRFAELQFRGQVHTVRVPVDEASLAANDGGETVIERFTELYEQKYGPGTAYRQAGVEAMTFAVEGTAELPISTIEHEQLGPAEAAGARLGERDVYFRERDGWTSVPVYDADRLRAGNEIDGPALVDAEDTTILVEAGHRLWVDELRNLRVDLR